MKGKVTKGFRTFQSVQLLGFRPKVSRRAHSKDMQLCRVHFSVQSQQPTVNKHLSHVLCTGLYVAHTSQNLIVMAFNFDVKTSLETSSGL